MKNQTLLDALLQGTTVDEQLIIGAKAIKEMSNKRLAPFKAEYSNGMTFVQLYNRNK